MRLSAVFIAIIFTFSLQSALAVEQERSHDGGNFAFDLNGNQAGWVQSVEGGHATGETVTTHTGLGAQPEASAPNVKTQLQPPHVAPVHQSTCAKPPCTLPTAKLKPATSTNAGLAGKKINDNTDDADTDKKPE
ncbi:MAG: hypothetical protein PSY14_01885 [bacterium]|nr:hypothetical protein [bacterium]